MSSLREKCETSQNPALGAGVLWRLLRLQLKGTLRATSVPFCRSHFLVRAVLFHNEVKD